MKHGARWPATSLEDFGPIMLPAGGSGAAPQRNLGNHTRNPTVRRSWTVRRACCTVLHPTAALLSRHVVGAACSLGSLCLALPAPPYVPGLELYIHNTHALPRCANVAAVLSYFGHRGGRITAHKCCGA